MIFLPPSSSGDFHVNLAESFLTSLTSRGPIGLLGGPARHNILVSSQIFAIHTMEIVTFETFENKNHNDS